MKRLLLTACCLVLASVLLPGRARAEKFALLVGIDNYPDPAQRLRGCLEDVRSVNRLLTERLGYASDKITVLTDAQATRQGIEEAFRQQLIARARPGDEVFFYYSGHGSFIPDFEGTAPDGVQGVLCPYDVNEAQPAATLLSDGQLRALLAALPTDRATVVLDSCHSGNITTRGGPSGTPILKAKYLRLGFDPADYNSSLPRRAQTRSGANGTATASGASQISGNPRHVILAACAADQSAYLLEPQGSVFTQAFVRAATALKPETTTYDDLMKHVVPEVAGFMREHGGTRQQIPQMKGAGAQLVVRLNPPATGSPSAIPPPASGQPNAVPAAYADFPLTVRPDKSTYREGEPMRLEVQAGRDCYLRLYHRDVNGNVQLLFPNAWQQDNRLQANRSVMFPGAGADFEFTAQPPFGSEIIKAVASSSQFTDLEGAKWEPGKFVEYGNAPGGLAETRTRGVKVSARQKSGANTPPSASATTLSEVEAIIRVLPR